MRSPWSSPRQGGYAPQIIVLCLLIVIVYLYGTADHLSSDISAMSGRHFALKNLSKGPWQKESQSEAYVYLITKENRLKAMLASEMSHRHAGSTRPRMAYVPETLDPKTYELFKFFDIGIIYTPPFDGADIPSLKKVGAARWIDTPLKFHLFNSSHSRLVCLDVDMLIRRSVDDLFDRELYPHGFYAAQDQWACVNNLDGKVSGGVQVLTHNETVSKGLLEMLYDPDRIYEQADQTILTEYWQRNKAPGHDYILGQHYMAFPERCECEAPTLWDDAENRILHWAWEQKYDDTQWNRVWTGWEDEKRCSFEYRKQWRRMYFEAEDLVRAKAPHLLQHLLDCEKGQ